MAAKEKQPEKERFYNGEGVDVTERIDKGKTKFFTRRYLAELWASAHRSYKYEIFNAPPGSSRTVVGYGIPK